MRNEEGYDQSDERAFEIMKQVKQDTQGKITMGNGTLYGSIMGATIVGTSFSLFAGGIFGTFGGYLGKIFKGRKNDE